MIVTVGVPEVPAGKPLAVRVSDTLTLAVCELDGVYHAFDQKCPHRAAALAHGEIAGTSSCAASGSSAKAIASRSTSKMQQHLPRPISLLQERQVLRAELQFQGRHRVLHVRGGSGPDDRRRDDRLVE